MGSTHLFPHGMNKGQLSWSSLNCWFGMSHLQLVFRTFWLSRPGFLNLHLWPPRILGPPCLEHKVCQEHKGMAPGQLILPRLTSHQALVSGLLASSLMNCDPIFSPVSRFYPVLSDISLSQESGPFLCLQLGPTPSCSISRHPPVASSIQSPSVWWGPSP